MVGESRHVRLLAGCMSGTSADGIDTALVRLEGDPLAPSWEITAFRTDPFSSQLREQILAAAAADSTTILHGAYLHAQLGEAYAEALQSLLDQAGIPPGDVDGIGLHGQTVFHDPEGRFPFTTAPGEVQAEACPVSLQLGSAAVVAERLGCDVVHDFRSRDVAAGGQGAPLVPYADAVLLRSSDNDRVAQNIGGIANLTWLPAGHGLDGVIGFDTGPGNMVLDGLVRRGTGESRTFDTDGELAREGKIIPELLDTWLSHPFLSRDPPKSTGREDFGDPFVEAVWDRWGKKYPLADLVATAVEFTAESIARAYGRFLPQVGADWEVVVSGGGARNPVLMERLSRRLAPARLMVSDELGLPVDAKEAVAFALLADAFLMGVPAGIPAVTGARKPSVLGSLVPGRGRFLVRPFPDRGGPGRPPEAK